MSRPSPADEDSPDSTSLSLIERVRRRDPQAWQRLVDVYGPLIYEWCRQRNLDKADAADILQEVFRAVDAKIGEFHDGRPGDSFRGWLWTITLNKIRDHCRRLASRPRAAGGSTAYAQLQQLPELPDEEPASSDHGDGGVMRRALDAIRVEFAEATWRAFWRCAVDGLPAAAVAAELGSNSHAVRQAKYRVMSRLRQELQGLDGQGLR